MAGGGEGDDKGWDGWMPSLTQWLWVWASSGRHWRTGKPGMPNSNKVILMGSQAKNLSLKTLWTSDVSGRHNSTRFSDPHTPSLSGKAPLKPAQTDTVTTVSSGLSSIAPQSTFHWAARIIILEQIWHCCSTTLRICSILKGTANVLPSTGPGSDTCHHCPHFSRRHTSSSELSHSSLLGIPIASHPSTFRFIAVSFLKPSQPSTGSSPVL